jgi:3-oxoacyl-[acyl-carrier protein] reductase
MQPISEQTVIVTGASRGLGRAIATAFAHEGASVVVNYVQSRDRAEALADELRTDGPSDALAVRADVREAEQVQAMADRAAEHFNRPACTLVSNALVDYRFDAAAREDADSVAWADYQAQLDGSLKAAHHLLRASLPAMKEAGFGRFIAIGTNLVQSPVVPYHDYTTAKAALVGFVRNMAQELGAHGITANTVSGGLLDRTDASDATSDEVFDLIAQNTPLGSVTTPEEMADAVLFFASPWARAVTGQNLIVDGGLVMQ